MSGVAMGVTVRKRGTKWMVDVRGQRPDGVRFRDRTVRTGSRTDANRWGLERERVLTFGETQQQREKAPTFAAFWPRYLENYVDANRQKHSVRTLKESIWRTHLSPAIGAKRLDEISAEDVQALKRGMADLAPKTVNNVLSTLGVLLRVAVQWEVIAKLPVTIALVKAPKPQMRFYEREELERLLVAAREVGRRAEIVVLLGGMAGLRSGEMLALEWRDVDLRRGSLTVSRNVYRGVVGSPKGGKSRTVPLAGNLLEALRQSKGAATAPVIDRGEGKRCHPSQLRDWMEHAQRLAGIAAPDTESGRLHILRHTFGSLLVLAGVNLLEVQRLMGHSSINTTMGYLHLVKGSAEAAIAALERGGGVKALKGRKRG